MLSSGRNYGKLTRNRQKYDFMLLEFYYFVLIYVDFRVSWATTKKLRLVLLYSKSFFVYNLSSRTNLNEIPNYNSYFPNFTPTTVTHLWCNVCKHFLIIVLNIGRIPRLKRCQFINYSPYISVRVFFFNLSLFL